MEFLRYFLIFVEAVSCALLVGVILIQRSKGQGLGLGFGGGMTESFLGAQAGNVLTRATVILSAVFLVTTTLIAFLYAERRQRESVVSDVPSAPIQAVPQAVPAGAPSPVAAPPVVPVGAEGAGDLSSEAAPTFDFSPVEDVVEPGTEGEDMPAEPEAAAPVETPAP